ncbi:MAG: hypothetical protein ACOYOK_00875 [Pseudobdellovibrionaceae bacterium]
MEFDVTTRSIQLRINTKIRAQSKLGAVQATSINLELAKASLVLQAIFEKSHWLLALKNVTYKKINLGVP